MSDIVEKLRAENERLRKENWEFLARGYTLINMLPDETMAGEIQEARRVFGCIVDTLKAENERLREALKPFAEVADMFLDEAPNDYAVEEYLGRFRAARKALGETDE